MYNFRTDLALERREILEKTEEKEIDGIEVEEKGINERLKISRIKVTNQNGEKLIRKTNGNIYNNRHKKVKNSNRRRDRRSIKHTCRRTKKPSKYTYRATRRSTSSSA